MDKGEGRERARERYWDPGLWKSLCCDIAYNVDSSVIEVDKDDDGQVRANEAKEEELKGR